MTVSTLGTVGTIGIVGVGLIGSSLARAAKSHASATQIIVYDSAPEHLQTARTLDIGTHYATTLADLASKADVVFVCTPVTMIANVIQQLAPAMKPGSIITDVGSVKSTVIAACRPHLPNHVTFVPAHPIAGTEHSGPAAGNATLLHGRTYIIISEAAQPSPAALKIAALVAEWGAKPVFMTTEQHDTTLGYISHLPHLLAYSMMNGAEDLGAKLGLDIASYGGGSFHDMTRIAASNPAMWRDIFMNNRPALLAATAILQEKMGSLIKAIESGNAEDIMTLLMQGQKAKLSLIQKTTGQKLS